MPSRIVINSKYKTYNCRRPRARSLAWATCATAAILILAATAGTPAEAEHAEVPQSIVIFIGDGMGFNHVAASSLYEHGFAGALVYEQFPVRLAVTTHSAEGHGYDPRLAATDRDYVRQGATDSGAASTALSTGVKTGNQAIGVDPAGRQLRHLHELAESLGKATGVVTTVQLSHATPAGFVAHVASRYDYSAIARQMLLESRLDVIIGAGHPWYDDDGRRLPEAGDYQYVGGVEIWQGLTEDLVGADADGDGEADPWRLIQAREEFLAIADAGATAASAATAAAPIPRRLLGLATVARTLQQKRGGDAGADPYSVPFSPGLPTLADMAACALSVLACDPDGFLLMVEGGAVDWASHDHQTGRMLEEMGDFNRAVETTLDRLQRLGQLERTLILVTADHECGYLTAAGAKSAAVPLTGAGRGNAPDVRWRENGHTNSLVPLYARGPGAERLLEFATADDPVRGPYLDNTDIAKTCFGLWEPRRANAGPAGPEPAVTTRVQSADR